MAPEVAAPDPRLAGAPVGAQIAWHVPDAVAVLDADARIVWANLAAERLTGQSVSYWVGRSGLDLVHPDDVGLAAMSLGSVQSKEVGTPIEIRVATPSGWRLVELIGVPTQLEGRDVTVMSLRDITDRRRWEIANDADATFRSLVQHSTTLSLLVDEDLTVRSSSVALTRLLGHDQELAEGQPITQLVIDADEHRLCAAFERAAGSAFTGPEVVEVTFRHGTEDRVIPYELSIVCLLDDPTVEGFIVSGHDIASRKAAEGELLRALSLLQATLDATADGILVVDRAGQISTYNRRFAEMWSVPHELLEVGDAGAILTHVIDQLEEPEGFLAKVAELNSHPELDSFDHLPFKDGRSFERFSMPQRVDGVVTGRVWSFSDVTQRKDLEEKLAHQAFHDSLTGLANQALFRERVEHLLARPGGPPDVAVAFLDLDNFKTINDSLGHTAGNELLVEVSRRIQSCLRATDTAARLGGDEFAVLLEGMAIADVSVVSDRLLEAMAPSLRIAGKDVSITCSIGIALGGPDVGCDQLLRNADLAMYTAKQRGKGRYEWFEAGMHAAALERLEIEVALRDALVRHELDVFYQPIYALDSGSVVGLEALVRWNHPEWGLVQPAAFVPVAEETGCIVEIGALVLAQACAQTRAWQEALGRPDLRVSVNLSPRQLRDPALPELVRTILAGSGLAPGCLILEITEGAMMVDPDACLAALESLKSLGLLLAIDDFGTGYSSLSYLQRFPIDVLKIDGTFVAGAGGRQEESALIAAIVHLADSLGLTAVAEGIETEAQAEALRAMGCGWAQGHRFARAQPASATFEILREAGKSLRQ